MNIQSDRSTDEVTLQNGDVSVSVLNRSGDSSIKALSHWAQLAVAVLTSEDVSTGQLDVAFITSEEISLLNEEHMGKVGPTDVLAFPLDTPNENAEVLSQAESNVGYVGTDTTPQDLLLGDVVINVERAQSQAAQFAVSIESEISLLLIHGVLHVLGYDHQEQQEREQMEAKERSLLAAVGYERRVNQ